MIKFSKLFGNDGYYTIFNGVVVIVQKEGSLWIAQARRKEGLMFVRSMTLDLFYARASTRKQAVDHILESIKGWNPQTIISYLEWIKEDYAEECRKEDELLGRI